MTRLQVVVVGGGIVGAAVARRLTLSSPRPEVTLVEKEASPGLHQTSRNSGVVHAGLYYAPGSAKATLSREGVRRLRRYCRERGLPYDEVGKLVIALDAAEEGRLRDIQARAQANGVPRLRWLGADALREVEPYAVGRAALHSPTTAITDFALVAAAMLADAQARGAGVLTGFEVVGLDHRGGEVEVRAADGRALQADRVVIAGGLQADRLATLAGDGPSPAIVPFRLAPPKLAPLSPITRWNRPLASGDAIRKFTADDPADSPNIVTRLGSPPNAAMFFCTHSSAATMSSSP